MIRKLYLEGEAHALLMAGLESFRASNMYVCAWTYMCTREMWTTSRHIWLWAASVPLLPIYMTMTRSDSIVSSLWTFNSQMSQLSRSRARHNAKTSGTWSKIPAKVSQCSKPPSNVSCLMAAHSQVRSIIARIYCGFEIKNVSLCAWDVPLKNERAVWPERCWKTIKWNGWHGESSALNLWLYLEDSCALRGTPHTQPGYTSFRVLTRLAMCMCPAFDRLWLQMQLLRHM